VTKGRKEFRNARRRLEGNLFRPYGEGKEYGGGLGDEPEKMRSKFAAREQQLTATLRGEDQVKTVREERTCLPSSRKRGTAIEGRRV